jgi:iron complex transport system ATP-binding protein
MEPSPVLDLHVERFDRDGQRILDDVRLTVRQSEHWTIVGPNGCGKSTLLSILSAYEWPTLGRVEVLGETYGRCDMNAMKRRIGIVGAALGQAISRRERAIDVVASGLYALLGPWRVYDEADYAAARIALSRAGIAADADKPYGLLSHGQKRRVAIARALVRTPAILVLDEPCEGLDPVSRERFLADIETLVAAPGAPTLLYVTHHLDEIPRAITHALVLREGRVVDAGAVNSVLTNETLSRAFEAPCIVSHEAGRFRLKVELA